MQELVKILNQSNASDYIIRQTNTVSQEVFFIGQKLDMGRAKNVTHTNVTVYVDSEDKKFRGSASIEVHPTSTTVEVEKQIKMEEKQIPLDINYDEVLNLSLEAKQKLSSIRPITIAQASRISGINPADISVLLIYLKQKYEG